jgi:hypothetical protein
LFVVEIRTLEFKKINNVNMVYLHCTLGYEHGALESKAGKGGIQGR